MVVEVKLTEACSPALQTRGTFTVTRSHRPLMKTRCLSTTISWKGKNINGQSLEASGKREYEGTDPRCATCPAHDLGGGPWRASRVFLRGRMPIVCPPMPVTDGGDEPACLWVWNEAVGAGSSWPSVPRQLRGRTVQTDSWESLLVCSWRRLQKTKASIRHWKTSLVN